jgi:hypothetical protein
MYDWLLMVALFVNLVTIGSMPAVDPSLVAVIPRDLLCGSRCGKINI